MKVRLKEPSQVWKNWYHLIESKYLNQILKTNQILLILMCVYIQRLFILHINIKALCIENLYIMGKKENDDKVTYLFICSQTLPKEPSQPSSSTEVKSMIKWSPSTQMPKSPKSPRSLVICGEKLTPLSKPD
jgi:hypothetical protein